MPTEVKRYSVNVYPTDPQRAFLGNGSVAMSQAIAIAAHLLEKAHGKLPFTANEWNWLAANFPEMKFGGHGRVLISASFDQPNTLLSQMCLQMRAPEAITRKVQLLDYAGAWALMVALQHYNRWLAGDDKSFLKADWWKPEIRVRQMLKDQS